MLKHSGRFHPHRAGKASVTVLILLFALSLRPTGAVTASAESFDHCHPRQPFGPGANNGIVLLYIRYFTCLLFSSRCNAPTGAEGSAAGTACAEFGLVYHKLPEFVYT